MTRSGIQFWFVFLPVAALGVFITLVCTGYLKALVSWFDALIGFDDWEPRQYRQRSGGRRRRRTRLGYQTMAVEDIAALSVSDLAGDDAHLYLWATREMFREGVAAAVARAWGFSPVGEIIWRKRNFGTGHFPRPGHEPVLVARRGRASFAGPYNVHSVQDWPQSYATNGGKSHTSKPDGLIDLAERVSPGPYVELFARQPRLGWDSWGFGYEGAA